VIVDTVSRALCGGDENSPKDMGQLVANMSRIQSEIDVHLLMTHHQPVDGKERLRGHGALLGAVDLTVHITKNGTGRLAEVVKSSDFEEGQRVAFGLKGIEVDRDEHGDMITAPVVVEMTAPAISVKRTPKISKNAKVALNALHDAVDECGERVANAHVPATVRVVKTDVWREYARRSGLGGDDASGQRKAFARAMVDLRASNLIGVWEPHAWPT
jgi:hypothetical protein